MPWGSVENAGRLGGLGGGWGGLWRYGRRRLVFCPASVWVFGTVNDVSTLALRLVTRLGRPEWPGIERADAHEAGGRGVEGRTLRTLSPADG